MTDELNSINTDAVGQPATPKAPSPKSGKRKKIIIIVACVVAVLLLAVFGVMAYTVYGYDRIYPGISIGGIDYSGKTEAAARQSIESIFSKVDNATTLPIVIQGKTYPLDLTACNITYNGEKIAKAAYNRGRSGSFFHRFASIYKAWRSGIDLPLDSAISVDGEKLQQGIRAIAEEIQQSLTQSAYTFDGEKLIVDRGQAGITIDIQELVTFIKNRIMTADYSSAQFDVKTVEPNELDLMMIKSKIECKAQNPALDLEKDPKGNTIIPAKQGITLDLDKAMAALKATDERLVELPLEFTQPSMTTEEFRAQLFPDILGECTTDFNPSIKGRTTNVLLATGFCNGIILNPGQEFSYNAAVGPRTYERGFMDAIVYMGASAEDGVGGGICQVSSTIYYASLRADMKITERSAHSRRVTYVPLGEDATVAWGSKDYKFSNSSDMPIKIVTSNTKNTITVKILGTNTQKKQVKMETNVLSKTPFQVIYQLDPALAPGKEKVKSNGYTGYVSETYRVVYVNGKEVSRTFENKSSYKKYDKVILHNPAPVVTPPTPVVPDIPAVKPVVPPAVDPVVPPAVDPVAPPTDPGTEVPPAVDPVVPPTDPTTEVPPAVDPAAPPTDPGTEIPPAVDPVAPPPPAVQP